MSELIEHDDKELATTEVGSQIAELILAAVKSGNPGAIQEIYNMYKEERKSQNELAFMSAFAKVQSELPHIPTNKQANYPTSKGGRVSYSFADKASVLALVRPILNKHTLAISFSSTVAEGVHIASCVIFGFGHTRKNEFRIAQGGFENTASNQAQQTAIIATYASRYALYEALGIMPSDEDTDAITNATHVKNTQAALQKVRIVECKEQLRDLVGTTKKPGLPDGAFAKFSDDDVKKLSAYCKRRKAQYQNITTEELTNELKQFCNNKHGQAKYSNLADSIPSELPIIDGKVSKF